MYKKALRVPLRYWAGHLTFDGRSDKNNRAIRFATKRKFLPGVIRQFHVAFVVFNYIFFSVGETSSSCSFCLQQNPVSLHIYLLPEPNCSFRKFVFFVEKLPALVSHSCQ